MFKYLKKYLFPMFLAPFFMMGEVLMDLLQPQLMARIVDDGVLGLHNGNVGDLSIVMDAGLKMIGLVLIGATCGILSGVFANLCSQQFGNDLRKDAFRKIMSFSLQDTEKFSTGSLITRVTNDITQIQNFVGMLIRGVVRTILLFCGGIVCMIMLDANYGIVMACALPIVFVIAFLVIGKTTPFFTILQKKLDGVNNVMQENVNGIRVVKAYGKEEYETGRFVQANDELVGIQLKVLNRFAMLTPLMNIVMNIAVVAVIWVSKIEIQAGRISPGNIMAAITYISQILNSTLHMVMISQNVSRGFASKKRIEEVLNYVPAMRECEEAADAAGTDKAATAGTDKAAAAGVDETATAGAGSVVFQNVSFSYPDSSGEIVLSHINLEIRGGETIGVLGATGSGKTTLISLITRFYDPTEGNVLVDGIDVKKYRQTELRNKVSVVLQKSELFSRSVRENLTWGNQNATEADLRKASDIAQASEFIDRMEQGLATKIAEQGMSISGGQKQRLSIARAILRRSEILIFDDATSALDLKTEATLYNSLEKEYHGVTKIIVAQRIASVKNADRILVMEAGEIVACDTHERLLENSAVYREIYNSQLKGQTL